MRVADIGCGVGTVTTRIAMHVGSQGEVIGIDSSADQVVVARREAAAAGLSNISFAAASAYDTGLARGGFDMVYCRFLLLHLQRPSEALYEMMALLKPGAMLVCEDIEADTLSSVPVTDAYLEERERVMEASKKRGVDYNVGRKLPGSLRQMGCTGLQARLSQPGFFRGEEKRLWEYSLAESAPTAIAAGFITQQEVDRQLTALRAVNDDESIFVIMPRVWQVCGRKS